jgi:hypothetical protein
MALTILDDNSAGEDQQSRHNKSGTGWLKRANYSPLAGTHWAILGLWLAADVVKAHETAIANVLKSLPEINSVADPRIWATTPASVAPDITEPVLHVEVETRAPLVTGSYHTEETSIAVRPPANATWMLANCVMAGPFADQAAIDTLLSKITTNAMVTAAWLLPSGQVPPLATSVRMRVTAHLRMDRIPVVDEPPE